MTIFDEANRWYATAVSRTVGYIELLIGRISVGHVGSKDAAKQLIDRANKQPVLPSNDDD
jgi:hypothetical protein